MISSTSLTSMRAPLPLKPIFTRVTKTPLKTSQKTINLSPWTWKRFNYSTQREWTKWLHKIMPIFWRKSNKERISYIREGHKCGTRRESHMIRVILSRPKKARLWFREVNLMLLPKNHFLIHSYANFWGKRHFTRCNLNFGMLTKSSGLSSKRMRIFKLKPQFLHPVGF